jgi:hypothetical protein
VFTSDSRYADAGTYQVTLPDGTIATVTRIPRPSAQQPIGWYPRGDAERLDVIAFRFLDNATKAWLLCDVNDAMSPDALAAHARIGIPGTGR